MTNVTQCPNCSAIFAISDEQFSASKGKVRCGNCREKFNVVFLPNQDDLVVNRKALLQKGADGSENTDSGQSDLLRILSEHAKREELELENRNTPTPEPVVQDDDQTDYDESSEIEHSEHSSDLFANSFSEEVHEHIEDNYSNEPVPPAFEQSTHTFTLNEDNLLSDELLDEVDNLVDTKLVGDAPIQLENRNPIAGDQTTSNAIDEPLVLGPSWQRRLLGALGSLTLCIVVLALLGILTYQLWLRQILPEPLAKPVATLVPFINPSVEKLTDQYDITLPERQDLNNLQLVSAHTEAHPSRASTILLRVSFLNKAKISQPLPKLELSLTDEDGRLVSRRSFQPNDYLYNNATENLILSNELKKVTIELLAFPRQAEGYELKMVN